MVDLTIFATHFLRIFIEAVAFLTFGPMVDIKSMMMFLGVFKRRVVDYLIILPLLMTA